MSGAIWRAVTRWGGTFMVASAVHEPRMWPLVVALGVFAIVELQAWISAEPPRPDSGDAE